MAPNGVCRFYGESFNKKKKEKTQAIQNSLPYRQTPERAAVISK